MRLLSCALLTGLLSSSLFAAPLNGVSFAHKDREVACDNTSACRAVGYSDNVALKTLHQALIDQQKTDPELDLSNIAKRFPLTGQLTRFTLSYTEDSSQPTTKPSPEISDDEWRAFCIPTFALMQKMVR